MKIRKLVAPLKEILAKIRNCWFQKKAKRSRLSRLFKIPLKRINHLQKKARRNFKIFWIKETKYFLRWIILKMLKFLVSFRVLPTSWTR